MTGSPEPRSTNCRTPAVDQVAHHAPEEVPVLPGHDVRGQDGEHLVAEGAVRLEVVAAAEQVVVRPGGAGALAVGVLGDPLH